MKRLIQLVLLLLGGAIVNVAVAWVIQFIPQPRTLQMYLGYDPYGNEGIGFYSRGFGSERVNCASANTYYPTPEEREQLIQQRSPFDWSVNRRAEGEIRLVEVARGWPMKSLYLCLEIRTGKLLGAFAFKNDSRSTGKIPRHTMPYVPLWPGFAINTIFYAAMLWVVFFVPGKLKRTLRRRRGLCPACAYPVGTSPVCTECGNQIPFPLRGRAREGVGRTETSNAHDDAERSTHPLAPSLKGGEKDPA